MSKTRWLVAGAGMMGKLVPPQMLRVGDEVTSYLGITEQEASQAADTINLRPDFVGSFDDFGGQLRRSDVHAVYIATPNFMHDRMAIAAAGAGKHVLSEKPLAITPERAKGIFDVMMSARVAGEINSQYRHAEEWDTVKAAIRERTYGAPTFINMEYLQDWQLDPNAGIGWRPEVEIAGRGKLVGDLGAHVLQTTLDAFGGTFVEFNGKIYNVHPVRYKYKGGGVETFSGGLLPTPEERPGLYEKMDMLDGSKYSGDDIATAEGMLMLAPGQLVPVRYRLSQVDAGRKNSFTADLTFERGRLSWNQEHPNQTSTTGPDCKTYVHERGSAPGIVGTPPGHPQGYGDEIANLLIKFDRAVHGGESERAEYTEGNIAKAVHTVQMCDKWANQPLTRIGKYQQ